MGTVSKPKRLLKGVRPERDLTGMPLEAPALPLPVAEEQYRLAPVGTRSSDGGRHNSYSTAHRHRRPGPAPGPLQLLAMKNHWPGPEAKRLLVGLQVGVILTHSSWRQPRTGAAQMWPYSPAARPSESHCQWHLQFAN